MKVDGEGGKAGDRLRLLLASSSVAALLIGGGGPVAFAQCAINDVGVSVVGSVSNSGAKNCINIQNSTVSGNVTNTATGALTATGSAAPTRTGITVSGGSIGGTISNAGKITSGTSGNGIFVTGNATVSGGIGNSGTISAVGAGIKVSSVAQFGSTSAGGGITNTGTISATGFGGLGIAAFSVSTFFGGIANSGTISVGSGTFPFAPGVGIVASASTFFGGLTNSGVIQVAHTGVGMFVGGSTFFGGIVNSGTITGTLAGGIELSGVSTFFGGVTNSGMVSASAQGITVSGGTTFNGGITNSGTIHLSGGCGFCAGLGGIAVANGTTGLGLGVAMTFAGGISNSGLISVSNQLSGIAVNGTTGGRTVVAMTFSGGIANTGTISAAAAAILVDNVASFAGGITNAGTVGAGGTALFVFGGTNFSGGITNTGAVTAGLIGINVDGNSALATFTGGVTNAGTIHAPTVGPFDPGIQIARVSTFSGNVSNSGLIVANTGIFVASVAAFNGAIVNSGTISGVHGIVTELSTVPLSIFDSGTIIGTSGFAINFGTGPNTLTLGPGFNIQGEVIGSGTDILQLGGTGSGTFDLSTVGAGKQYQGFTTFNVVSGTWTATGTFSPVPPAAWNVLGGTLAGTATFQSVNVNSGGTLEPGTIGTPGTFMTITGNLAFQPGANYLVNLNPTTASRANVGGTVSLTGAVLGFLAPGSYSTKTTYDILDPTSISGKFTGFTSINAPGFTGTLTYQPTDVLLNLTASLGGGGALNGNQQSVANAINSFFNNGGTLPADFFPLFGLTGNQLGNALAQVSGEAATGGQLVSEQMTTEFLTLMLDPTLDGRGGAGATPFAPERDATFSPELQLAYARALKAPEAIYKAAPPPRWSAWGTGFGGYNRTNGDAAVGSHDVTARDGGVAAGADYRLSPDTLVGFALAGGGLNWGLAQGLGGGRADSFMAGIYGKRYFGPAYVAGAAVFANHWMTTNRTAAFGDQLSASFNAQSFGARLEAGDRFAVPAPAGLGWGLIGVTPYAALQSQSFHTPSYSEADLTGGGFALSFNSMDGDDTRSELGARFDDRTMLSGMPLVLRGRLAWAHDWVSNPALNAVFQALPGSAFTVNGAKPPADSALTSASAELWLSPSWSVTGKFDGEFANGAQTYAGTGTVRYRW